jgi:hypothetical protein
MTRLTTALLALGLCAGALGCAPKLYFDQTFHMKEELKVTDKGYASLASEETFDLGPVIKAEKRLDRVLVIKLHGTFFLIGDGFRNLWKLTPASSDQASYEPVKFDGISSMLNSPSLEVVEKCVVVSFSTKTGAEKRFVTSGGKVGKDKCPDA